jgi:hypothetical protein
MPATRCASSSASKTSTTEDIYDKKGGALEFVVRRTQVHNQRDACVAELRTVTVLRNA